MIELDLFAAFVLASALLILLPGPNVALIVSHSIAHGTRYGLLTAATITFVQIVPLTMVALGLSAAVALLADWFAWLRWLGVAYLIVLGIATWRAAESNTMLLSRKGRVGRIILVRSVLVAATNPKTLLFYGAFFPQFVNSDRPVLPQFAVLSLAYIVVAFFGDSLWAIAAGRVRTLFACTARIRNKILGAFFVFAAFGLAFARRNP